MKKIVVLLAFLLLTATSFAQNNLITPFYEGTKLLEKVPDPYPLIEGTTNTIQGNTFTPHRLLKRPTYSHPGYPLPALNWDIDPGILITPRYFNIDPRILLTPKFGNCDPGMVVGPFFRETSQETVMPNDKDFLLPNSLITPFFAPGADLFHKYEEFRSLEKLDIPESRGN
jgi:hypothetical protein